MTTTNNNREYAIRLYYEVREADNSINCKTSYKVFDNMQDAANYAINFIANNPDVNIRLTNEHFDGSQISVYGDSPTKHYNLTDADINAVRNAEINEADVEDYAVTTEAMEIATTAEIANDDEDKIATAAEIQFADVKEEPEIINISTVTVNDGYTIDTAKVTIEQAVNIISRLNYRNDTFQYRFTTREDNADIQYRHFDAYRDNGDKDAFAISEIVINGKLEIVRFYNLFRDIIVDLHIGNLNYTLGYRGAIEIADEHSVNYDRFLIDIDVENTETGNCVTKSHFQSNACDAANWIINFAAKHHNRKIIGAKIRDFKFSRMVYQFTDADINAINAEPFVKTTRQADALKDKIARDAKASDDSNVFDLLPDVDDLPDVESEWQYLQGIYRQIKREQGDFTTKIGVATVTFRDWQVVEICDGFTSYKKVNGKPQYRISGRLVSRKEFEEYVLYGTDDKPEPPTPPTGIYDELLNTPVTDKQERIEELADAINENSDAWHEADFLLTVAQRQGDTKRADELKNFMGGCIADAYQLNAALDALIKPSNTPTNQPPEDDFNSQLERLRAAANAAHDAEDAARRVLDEAEAAYDKAKDFWRDAHRDAHIADVAITEFLDEKTKELRDDLLDEDIFNANIAIIAQAGKCFDQPNLAGIWIDATPDQKLLINSCTKFFATYDTPEQVRQAVNLLRDAINRGDTEFKFPTIGELNKPTTANEWRTVRTKTNPRNVNLTAHITARTNA